MSYIESKYVKVYPTAYRGTSSNDKPFNPESRLNSEFNITQKLKPILKKNLVAKTCIPFVLNDISDSTPDETKYSLQLDIKGYWFEVKALGIKSVVSTAEDNSKKDIYAHIYISSLNNVSYSTGTEYEAWSLSIPNSNTTAPILDVNDTFYGLEFLFDLDSPLEDNNNGYLHILHKDNDTGKWSVPSSSALPIISNQIENASNPGKTINEIFNTGDIQVGNSASIGGNTTIQGTLGVSGALTAGSTLDVTGVTTILDDLTVKSGNNEKFKVTNSSGNTNIAGTLDVGGASTLKGNLAIKNGTTNKFTVDTSGNISAEGTLTTKSTVTFTGINKPAEDDVLFPLTINKSGSVVGTDLTQDYDCTDTTGLKVITGINLDSIGKISSCTQTAIPKATTSSLGVVKSTTTGTEAGKDYYVEVIQDGDDAGKMKVNVAWENTGHTHIDGEGISVDTGSGVVSGGETGSVRHNLLAATSSSLGGIKTGFTQSGQNYPVELNSNNKAYVYVPWTDYRVRQNYSATDGNYPLLMTSTKGITSTEGRGDVTTILNNQIYANPNTGGLYAVTFYASSDRRIKENIREFIPKKSILDLPIVEFDYVDSKTHHIGCIAQDLQEICPEIVHENASGYLTIEENKLVYLLINEVKELKKEIKELKGE